MTGRRIRRGEVEDYDPEADWSPGDEFLPGEAAEFRAPLRAIITEDISGARSATCSFLERTSRRQPGGRD